MYQGDEGRRAILGVLIEEGDHNAAFDVVWSNLPDRPGVELKREGVEVDIKHVLPSQNIAFRYLGSLTTPNCAEGVLWHVYREPVQLSAQQIAIFTKIFDGNIRPVQPLNGRAVSVVALQTGSGPRRSSIL